MKIGIVNDIYHFSTADVAIGFKNAFEQLGCKVVYADPSLEYRVLKEVYRREGVQSANFEMVEDSYFVIAATEPILHRMVSQDVEFVLFIRGANMPTSIPNNCRKCGMRTGVYLTDEPYEHDLAAMYVRYYDFVFSNERNNYFGIDNYWYIPVAFDSVGILDEVSTDGEKIDVCFIGTFFDERIELFEKIEKNLRGLKLIFGGLWASEKPKTGFVWRNLSHNLGVVDRRITLEGYSRSKIGLNLHRNSNWKFNSKRYKATGLNPRVFELAGIGCFQLVDSSRRELREMFTEDEIVSFGNHRDLRRKIDKYLESDIVREEVAMAAKENVLNNHTYTQRVEKMLNQIN